MEEETIPVEGEPPVSDEERYERSYGNFDRNLARALRAYVEARSRLERLLDGHKDYRKALSDLHL